MNIPNNIVTFFQSQRFTIISTIDKNGCPHNSCKGIVEMGRNGTVYLLDLYKAVTYQNLMRNSFISITAVDEHKFTGYCLKGKAAIVKKDRVNKRIFKLWEDKITGRITHRLLKNMRGEKGHAMHPEALLPKPTYLIAVEVKEIVELMPPHIKQMAKEVSE